jgi:hypothetical protein
MDAREKVLADFKKVKNSSDDKLHHAIYDFLKDLFHYLTGDIFIIGEKDDFSIRKVEGYSFFDVATRTFNFGSIDGTDEKILFESLVNIMLYYQFAMGHPDDKHDFMKNQEQSLAYDYLASAVTKYFLDSFVMDSALKDILCKFGLIDELMLIQMFAKKYVDMIEYEGDLSRLLEKIQDTINLFQEVHETPEQDTELLAAMGTDADTISQTDADHEEFMRNLLENLTLD